MPFNMHATLPEDVWVKIFEILVLSDPDIVGGSRDGLKALSSLLRVSRLMHRLVFPIFYSRLWVFKVEKSESFEAWFDTHPDKKMFSYFRQITFLVAEGETNRNIDSMLLMLERMENIEELSIEFEGPLVFLTESSLRSLKRRALFKKTLLRLKHLTLVGVDGSPLVGVELIEKLDNLQALSISNILPSKPLVLPKNLKKFVYEGQQDLQLQADAPFLKRDSISSLGIQLSTIVKYLDQRSPDSSIWDILPSALRHLHLSGSLVSEKPVLRSFLPVLSQLPITNLELDFFMNKEDVAKAHSKELAEWIDAFPSSLTHWCLRYMDTRSMEGEESDIIKQCGEQINCNLSRRQHRLKELKTSIERKFWTHTGYLYNWDSIKNKAIFSKLLEPHFGG